MKYGAQLTGKEIVESGILTNIDLENAVQQQGVDLRLDRIQKVGGRGAVPAQGKTTLGEYIPYPCMDGWFRLAPGYYEVVFMEGCNVPKDLVISNIKTRSSVCRVGAEIVCGQFDAGFSTDQMGCFLRVNNPVDIQKGARIGQVQVFRTSPVEEKDLYNGQWQHDKQREQA